MMKKILFGLSVLSVMLCTSCIQDEPLMSECDIEQATLVAEDELLLGSLFYNTAEAVKEVIPAESEIIFYTRNGLPDNEILKNLKINFKLTHGATITPENGSAQDFSNGSVRYRVTSEDKQWHRDYTVTFTPMPYMETLFSFENFKKALSANGTKELAFYEWFETTTEETTTDIWATGNRGFYVGNGSAKEEEYPTRPCTQDFVQGGSSVILETRDAGPFAWMFYQMPMAAGNLFFGTFDSTNALDDPMTATRFGIPFNRKPLYFNGYYKYKPGNVFINRNKIPQEGRTDAPDLYAVMYKNTDENGQPITLKGDDVLTHRNIVALARIKDPSYDFNNWTHFSIPFEYYKDIDQELLKAYGYNLAIVLTSSIEGANFCGAIGSTLLVDELQLVCEEE